jgi:UDP-N-acetylmuramoylalanine--D-glutamate ligase
VNSTVPGSGQLSALPESLNGRQIAVWGFGLEGQAAAEYLQEHWPQAAVMVFCSASERAEYSAGQAANQPANQTPHWDWCNEPVTASALDCFDLVIKSPGISPYQSPADQVRVPMATSAALWFAYHRQGRVITVTGTKGKSTTSSLLAHVLRGLDLSVNLAGNIGTPLLETIGQPADWTVLETSSYQAADGYIIADVAVLLNLFPEHLDWHGSEARYYQDKLQLLKGADKAILGTSLEAIGQRLQSAGMDVPHSLEKANSPRWRVSEGSLHWEGSPVFCRSDWALPGDHNLQNLAAVLQVIETLFPAERLAVDKALQLARSFQPLPHRLQPLGQWGGRYWINDSIASTPHATLAALATVNPAQTAVIVGGYDRQLDWQEFAHGIATNPPACVIATGDTTPRILQALRAANLGHLGLPARDLAEAVTLAKKHTPAGGTVLLSPGAPSFDAFANYTERGEAFARLAREQNATPDNAQSDKNSASCL